MLSDQDHPGLIPQCSAALPAEVPADPVRIDAAGWSREVINDRMDAGQELCAPREDG